MKNLAIKFLGATALVGFATCWSEATRGGVITLADEHVATRIRLLMEAKQESAKLERVGFQILAHTIATTVTATGDNTRNITPKICALYNGKRAVEGPQELRRVYSQALNKEMSLGGETKDNSDLRGLIMDGTVNAINKNVQEVRKACQFKFGT